MKSTQTAAYRGFLATLARARHDAGMTQWDLAKRLGKPQSFVSKVEAGERRLDVVEFVEIARILDLDPADAINELRAALQGPRVKLRQRPS